MFDEETDMNGKKEKEEFFVMNLKNSNDTLVWHIVFIGCGIVSAVAGLIEAEILVITCLSLPLLLASVVLELYRRGRSIVVTKYDIENIYFYVFSVRVPWECVCGYRQKHKRGEYIINTSLTSRGTGVWSEEEYKIKLYFGKKRHITVSNSFTDYKRFKKLVKEKEIAKLKKERHKPNKLYNALGKFGFE